MSDKEEEQAQDNDSDGDGSTDSQDQAHHSRGALTDSDEDSSGGFSLCDDWDWDFDFTPVRNAYEEYYCSKRRTKDFLRCRYYTKEEEKERQGEPDSKKRRVEDNGLAGLPSVAKSIQRLQLLCFALRSHVTLLKLPRSISGAIGESLLHRLSILHVDNFGGSGDPIFGSTWELRRKYDAMEHDLFELLAAAFVSGGKCSLKKLMLSGGFMSAESLMKFLRVAKPPLESFRCRHCLFHGRNFEPLVKALKASTTAPSGLLEFEMNAYVGGKDPFGLLADAFPNLQMLRAKRIFGEAPAKAGLKRLKSLVKSKCVFPKPRLALGGDCKVASGCVRLSLLNDRQPDNYRGQGLFWDDLRNTSEKFEKDWAVGKVSREQVLAFMAECGIRHDTCWYLEPPDDRWEVEDELEIFALQVAVEKSPDGLVAIRGTTLGGREVATLTAVDPNAASVRTVMEEFAQKYPCDCLGLRLALPDGSVVDVLSKGNDTLASVLK